jgi:hypothetical protein
MLAEFCGVTIEDVYGQPASPGEARLSKREQDALILQFAYWQDSGARPLPLLLGGKFPGLGWRQDPSPTVDIFSDLVRNNETHGISVPLSESDAVIDIEGRARRMLPAVEAAAEPGDLALLRRVVDGLTEETPSGGLHIHLRLRDGLPSRKVVLARRPKDGDSRDAEVLVELLGFGQQVVVAPSGGTTHDTGRPYRRLRGDITSIATVTAAELARLCNLFRLLDSMPSQKSFTSGAALRRPQTRIELDFNARRSWEEILSPKGWTLVRGTRHQSHDVQYWRRPGKRTGQSATTCGGTLCVFSCSTDAPQFQQPSIPGERGTNSLTKFDAYTAFWHGGDRHAALRAARGDGFGDVVPPRPRLKALDTGSAVRFLAECLISATAGGPQSKQDICKIAATVVPPEVLLFIANRERRATGRQTLKAFGPTHDRLRQWACERVSRSAIEILIRSGQAEFNHSRWVLSRKMEMFDV